MKNKLSLKFKTLAIILSIVFSFSLLEAMLRVGVWYMNKNRIYSSLLNTTIEHYDQDIEKNNNYSRSNSIEIYNDNLANNFEILTMGDSFTNGGNIKYEKSYPYQLYKKISDIGSVRNMGICEATSADALNQFEKFLISTDFIKEKKYAIYLLVGATDIFFSNIDSSEDLLRSTELKQNNYVVKRNINSKILELFDNVKSVKLFIYLFQKIIENYDKATIYNKILETTHVINPTANSKLKVCESLQNEPHVDCIADYIISSYSGAERNRIAILFAIYFQSYTSGQDSLFYSQQIKNIIHYYLRMGDYVEKEDFFDLITSVSYLTMLQNKYTSADVISDLKLVAEKYKNKVPYDSFERQFNNFKYWSTNKDDYFNKMETNINKIITLAKKSNIALTLMTYPLEYKELNTHIKNIAQKNNTPLIDLEQIFKKNIENNPQQKLTQDGEHCTDAGYYLIADEIFRSLNKSTDKN